MKIYVGILYGVLVATLLHNAIAVTGPEVRQLKDFLQQIMASEKVHLPAKYQVYMALQVIWLAENSPHMVALVQVIVEILKLCNRSTPTYYPSAPSTAAWCSTPAGAHCPNNCCLRNDWGDGRPVGPNYPVTMLPPGAYCPSPVGAFCEGGYYCRPGSSCPRRNVGGPGLNPGGPGVLRPGGANYPLKILPPGANCPLPAGAYCEGGFYCLPGTSCPRREVGGPSPVNPGEPGVVRPGGANYPLKTLPPGANCPLPAGAYCEGGLYCLPGTSCPRRNVGGPGVNPGGPGVIRPGEANYPLKILPPGANCPLPAGAYCEGGLYCLPGTSCPRREVGGPSPVSPGGPAVIRPGGAKYPLKILPPGANCPLPAGAYCEGGVYCLPGTSCPRREGGGPGVVRPGGANYPLKILPPGANCPLPAGAYCEGGLYCLPGTSCPLREVGGPPPVNPVGPAVIRPGGANYPLKIEAPLLGQSSSTAPTPSKGPSTSKGSSPSIGPSASGGPSYSGAPSDSSKNFNENVNNIIHQILNLQTSPKPSLRDGGKVAVRKMGRSLVLVYPNECVMVQIVKEMITRWKS